MERKQSTMTKLKGKLISALCMLLVAATMVISSSYAWFTLSTAPEVSGITTAIGANGALEIWLNTTDTADENYIPGNIVDLAAAKYGLGAISLLPSKISMLENSTTVLDPRFLQFPEYGPNGRPGTSLDKTSAAAGLFNGMNFVEGSGTGVRAVGVASGLTDRQAAYRNAKYAASNSMASATTTAVTSLNQNGAVLGNIVIKKVSDANATYTADEVASLEVIIADLERAIVDIETAYKEMIVAFAASNLVPVTTAGDAVYSTIRTNFANGTLTLAQIVTDKKITVGEGESAITVNLEGSAILQAITALQTTKGNVESARDAYATLSAKAAPYTWADISSVTNWLIEANNTKLNGTPVEGSTKDQLANAVLGGGQGVTLSLENGAGVYVEIAAHCGNYSATVSMKNVTAAGITLESLTITMKTNSTQNPSYLENALEQVVTAGAPASAGETVLPMTEFYGFILDLAFRTNAANSNLLLQTEAADRIYEDNNNEATQGKGSYMTYKATTTELTTDAVKGLMDCIRIVFFDTETREIIGEARLDTANATISTDGVTAKMYMYEKQTYYAYTDGDGHVTKYYVKVTTTTPSDGAPVTTYAYYTDAAMTTLATDAVVAIDANAASAIPAALKETVEYVKKTGAGADVITALGQNTPVKLSVLVYLDGETITNANVAATAAKSVTGSMNLQFASDADLVPMEYGKLHTPGTNNGGEGTN